MSKVAVSLLNVENKNRSTLTKKLMTNGLDWVHYDIMDGVFVPNAAISFEEVEQNIKESPKHFIDIHLMVADADRYIMKFKPIADLCTFHYESDSFGKIEKLVSIYKDSGIKIGLAINPKTNVEQVYGLLKSLDVVLVMSVQPGKGGQSFQNSAVDKISKLRKYIDQRGLDTLIEVDGGINVETGNKCLEAGADVLVSGSFLCNNPNKKTIMELKKD